MNDQSFVSYLAAREKIKAQASEVRLWRTALKPVDKQARFPGFHQRTVNYKAGQQVEPGCLPLPVDIVMHESVPMLVRDNTKLYCDIFLPSRFQSLSTPQQSPVPTIIAWSPYGKQKGMTLLDDFPARAGVPKDRLSGLEKWEGPDPAYWCQHDYAIINVDSRGAYTSEGNLEIFGQQEAEDGSDFINWVSEQPWCNGKVALTGNSWLAIVQWGIGSLRPKGLAALAPWEGFSDMYRSQLCAGGIPFLGFHESIANAFASEAKIEDVSKYLLQHELMDDYWEEKKSHPEYINVPSYVVASWSNPVHTPGTFKAWSQLPDNIPKWLRVHNKQEWSDYYSDDSRADLRRFFDFYLHGKTNNGWDQTPTVRISVLNFGLLGLEDTVNRPESSFPLARTQHRRYFLQPDHTLSLRPGEIGILSYNAAATELVFEYEMPKSVETTGYFMAHLLMSCGEHDDMDVFVQVEKLSAQKNRQGVLCVVPQSISFRMLLKLMHDWHIGLQTAGMAFHWGPDGQLRASHAQKVPQLSRIAEPYYAHTQRMPLGKGEVRALDIPMRPYGLYWEKGSYLRFKIAGKQLIPFAIPGLEMHRTNNRGNHTVHCGTHGEDSSYLLVPHV